MAAGVLAVSLADAAGRTGSASTVWGAAYWLGELLVFAPLAARVLSRTGPGESEAAGLVICAAAASYVIKYLYSPASFGFPDELEHWRSTSDLLTSHHLFGANYLLPVSPNYPGLEEAAGALASVTGLPVFAAGMIIAGLSHLLLAGTLFVVFRLVSGSPRIALAACAIYATNPHYQVFDAIYSYQTLALAFFGLAVVAALRIASQPRGADQARWWILAVALATATVVTHHVTSYMLALTLLLIAAVSAARRLADRRGDPVLRRRSDTDRSRARGLSTLGSGTSGLAVLAGICVTVIVVWVRLRAPITLTYLYPTFRNFVDGLTHAFTAHAAARGATPAGPLADQLGSYAVTALIMLGLPFGWRQIWRHQRQNTWALALGVGAAGYYACTLLRVTAPDGTELTGRILTFVYIPVGYTLAMALAWLRQATLSQSAGTGRTLKGRLWVPPRATRAVPVVLAAASAGILLFGGIASGWPPFWERLPGHYVVDGFESGITTEGIAAATWARSTLGPGQRIAADFTNYTLLGSIGDEAPVSGVDQLYCSPSWTVDEAALAHQEAVRYLLVDLRTSEYAAVTAGYFPDSSTICPAPIPTRDLTKFDTVPGINRIYDSGNIIIYAISGAYFAP
jgi:hypothetical protein